MTIEADATKRESTTRESTKSPVDPTVEFVGLLTATQARLYGYLMTLVSDPNDASDLLQQTNAVLWEKRECFELGTNFIAWSFRIAHFQVMAHRKRKQRNRLAFDNDLLSQLASEAEAREGQFSERQDHLRDCLSELPTRQRKMIQLRYSDGSTLSTIADDCRLSVNAVKQLLLRARRSLSTCIERKIARVN